MTDQNVGDHALLPLGDRLSALHRRQITLSANRDHDPARRTAADQPAVTQIIDCSLVNNATQLDPSARVHRRRPPLRLVHQVSTRTTSSIRHRRPGSGHVVRGNWTFVISCPATTASTAGPPMKTRGLMLLVLLTLAAAGPQGCAGSAAPATGWGRGSTAPAPAGPAAIHCTTTACVPAVSAHLAWAVEIDPLQPVRSRRSGESQSSISTTWSRPLTSWRTADDRQRHLHRPDGRIGPLEPPTSCSPFRPHPRAPGVDLPGADRRAASTGMSSASLTVPSDRLGSAATLALVPLPPADQQSPPCLFSVDAGATLVGEHPDR